LKSVKNLYVLISGITACSLFVVGLAGWHYSGIGEGWCFGGFMQEGTIGAIGIVGAVGVIWLGWYWLRLVGAITSIARRLKRDGAGVRACPYIRPNSNAAVKELSEAMNNRLGSDADYIAELEKQIKDLRIQVQLSKRQKVNTEAIIYSIRDAVIVIDEFDRLLMANDAAGGVFNFDFRDSQHEFIGELIGPERDEFVNFLRQCRRSKVRHTRREISFSGDGELKTFDCIASCLYDEKKQVYGVVAVLHDITREKEKREVKNDFVSAVCHELKTPLASITAYSEMLLDGEAKDGQTRKEFYSVIQSQTKRLNRLIEDVLNSSHLESGLMNVRKKPVSLTVLIEEQLQMIKGYAHEKDISLSWGDVGGKPIVFDQVCADKDMIQQVIVNLLSNAVKYTRPGGLIKIETEVDEVANLARVSVTDTGVGIDESELEHIFDKFYRVGANKAQAKGTGLGLNLVKQIIEKVHNGRVFVASQVGVGSTFGFELPLATAEAIACKS